MSQKSRKSEENRQSTVDRNRSSSDIRNSELRRTSSVTRATGLNSHPVEIKPTVPVAVAITTTATVATSATMAPQMAPAVQPLKLSGPIPRAPANMPSRVRQSALAREARVPRESVLDFADFIRTTGPPGESMMPASRVSVMNTSVRATGGPLPASKAMPEARRVSSASKMRLQAREASVNAPEDNSDLIDFIRQGPPSARENPRIPRTVAPFRSTMDSDQMSGAVGGRAVDANLPNIRYSQASTNVTDMSMPSVHSSINSRSELIKKTSSVNKPLPSANDFDDADMMPKRKTRRARDPYAIDFSDEEDDDDMVMERAPAARPPPQREESLMDFLRSVPPPPDSRSPTVPFDIPQTRQPKKKASAPSLMSRFGRGSTTSPTNNSFNAGSSASTIRPAPPVSMASTGSRPTTGRGYIPIQVNMPAALDPYGSSGVMNQPTANVGSSYRSVSGTMTTTTTGATRTATTGRVAMKKFEPREAVSKGSRTSELADFLRSSAPPPSFEPSMPSPSADDGRVRSVFGGRKKATYA